MKRYLMRRNLELTEAQSTAVQAGANGVPAPWRDRYLCAVADFLMGREHITDADVTAAVQAAQFAMITGASSDDKPAMTPERRAFWRGYRLGLPRRGRASLRALTLSLEDRLAELDDFERSEAARDDEVEVFDRD